RERSVRWTCVAGADAHVEPLDAIKLIGGNTGEHIGDAGRAADAEHCGALRVLEGTIKFVLTLRHMKEAAQIRIMGARVQRSAHHVKVVGIVGGVEYSVCPGEQPRECPCVTHVAVDRMSLFASRAQPGDGALRCSEA